MWGRLPETEEEQRGRGGPPAHPRPAADPRVDVTPTRTDGRTNGRTDGERESHCTVGFAASGPRAPGSRNHDPVLPRRPAAAWAPACPSAPRPLGGRGEQGGGARPRSRPGVPPTGHTGRPRPVSEVTHRSGNAPAGPAPRTRVAPPLKEGAGCLPSPAEDWNSNGDGPRPTQTRGGAGPGGRGDAATRSPANPPLLLTPGVADEGRVARGLGAPEATPRSRSHRVGWPGHPHCGPPRPGIARSHAPGPGDPAARAGASRTRGSLPGAECHFYADRCATSAMA